MKTIHIKTSEELYTYLTASLAYSCLTPEAKAQWLNHAVVRWYAPLLRAGYTNIPLFVVLDLGGRMVLQGRAYINTPGNVSNRDLFYKYSQTLDLLCRDPMIRDTMADITMHQQDQGIVDFLERILRSMWIQSPVVVAMENTVLKHLNTFQYPETQSGHDEQYGAVFTHFIETFSQHVADQNRPEDLTSDKPMLLSEFEKRLILGRALQDHTMSYPDLELMDRCMHMEDLPPLISHDQEHVMRSLHSITLEQPMSRSDTPEGGYIGIRNNGSVEDLTNPVMSEWAQPTPVLWEKLTNRSLLVYERASRSVPVRRMLLHLILLNHTSLQQIDDVSGRLPVREMKYLMAAIIRDLVGYLCQLRTVDIQLNIQVVSGPEVDLNVHSVNLTGMTVDRIRQAHHFLFEERDMFPWFFSSHLAERHALTTLDQVDDAGPMDLEEECLPERDIMFGEHCTGFENVHCLVFSANKPYQTIRHAVIDHLRDYIDLGPTSLDSMVGVLLDENISDAPTWHLDFIQQYHRAFEKDDAETDLMTGQTGHPDMADNAIRETIRRYFLSRLLGMKYRV